MSVRDKVQRTLLKTLGHTMAQFSLPRMKACHYREVMRRAKVGDILMRTYNWNLASRMIPGKYSHSGIVISDGNMMHAVGTNTERIDILDFINATDNVCIMRPREGIVFDVDACVNFALSQEGKPYDFKFKNDDCPDHPGFMYCHKFTNYCYWKGGLKSELQTVRCVWIFKQQAYTCASFSLNPSLYVAYEAMAKQNPP